MGKDSDIDLVMFVNFLQIVIAISRECDIRTKKHIDVCLYHPDIIRIS